MKVSLIDLARKLENDLIIFETAPGLFKLDFKEDKIATLNDDESMIAQIDLFYKVRYENSNRFSAN